MSRPSIFDDFVCPVFARSGKCDQDALRVMEQFKNFYESKLNEIDVQGGGDSLELKCKVQRRWIDDLTEQTQMMARIVKELEDEATNRVRMLEDKLKQTSQSAYEKVFYLESDMKNLLEFIRRIREDRKWSIDGLQFYDVTHRDLFGKELTYDSDDVRKKDTYVIPYSNGLSSEKKESASSTEKQECGDVGQTVEEVLEQLKKRNEEYDELRQSMFDMRSALTEEVACKHDIISALKKDVQQLEERCVQADKQTAFKDDIIKELRKEIRQLKQQNKEKEDDLTKKLQDAHNLIKKMRPCVDLKSAHTTTDDKLGVKKKEKDLEDEISRRQNEVDALKCKCEQLEKTLASSQGRAENLQKAELRNALKSELKKLRQQNRCYEHVVACFKHEMAVMSEQLIHLQEILNLSNMSCKEENGQLHNAVLELQKLSEKLQGELVDTERKVLIENQKNQLKDAKIDELQLLIGQKNADLNVHDVAINDMKARLENAMMENHELQGTIVALNTTVMQLQCCLQNQEVDKAQKLATCRSRPASTKRSHSDCRDDYERKSRKLDKLQEEYREQYDLVKSMQRELEKVKEKNREKSKQLKRQNDELKEKLATCELSNQNLIEQLKHLKDKMGNMSQKEYNKDHELNKSRQVILEIRQNLMELNDGLIETESKHVVFTEEYQKSLPQENEKPDDIYASCRCEMNQHKKLADNVKEALTEAKKKVRELEAQIKSLNDELKRKDVQTSEIVKNASKKEKETCQCIEDLSNKLKEAQNEERRLSQFIENLKREVQRKIEDKNDARKLVINCCECNDMSSTQEEIDALKIEIKNMIQNQLALNNENDKLLKQVTCLQSNIASLDDKNRYLKQKLEKFVVENQNLKEKTKTLLREKESLIQSIRNLEVELADSKNNCDDLCAESRHVVNNVKAWLEEQKKVNNQVKKKTQCYYNTIAKLKEQNETLLRSCPCAKPAPFKPLANSTAYNEPSPNSPYMEPRYETTFRTCSPADCQNMWGLGSQGTGSVVDSPRDSPLSCSCSVEEWYSPNYRDDDETTDRDEDLAATLEEVTRELRKNNRKLKSKCRECVVSRDNN